MKVLLAITVNVTAEVKEDGVTAAVHFHGMPAMHVAAIVGDLDGRGVSIQETEDYRTMVLEAALRILHKDVDTKLRELGDHVDRPIAQG